MKYLFKHSLFTVLLLPLIALALAPRAHATELGNIWPLGDSVTYGAGHDGGYRETLCTNLIARGYTFKLVGTQTSNSTKLLSATGQSHHDGHSGYAIANAVDIDGKPRPGIYEQLESWHRSIQTPDVILLLIGINDLNTGYKIDSAPERLDLLVTRLFGYYPHVRLLIASLPYAEQNNSHRHGATNDLVAAVNDYNAEVVSIVTKHRATGQSIALVDMHARLTLADLQDGLHPSAEGYVKMGNIWADALVRSAAVPSTSFSFNFGGQFLPGAILIEPTNYYSAFKGFGFEPGSRVVATNGCITGAEPFYFSVRLPEGNYRVTVSLGNSARASTTTIKAELRRLMLYHIETVPGEFAGRSFVVNLRTPNIAGGDEVHLKPREKTDEWRDWDDKLTLEFDDSRPCIHTLTIQRVDVPTIYILGDSTVCDQPFEPWDSWGQMLPVFFKPAIAVANDAESGETIADSLARNRFKKVFSLMKPGDYLFVQFGHNDMKSKRPDALEQYKTNLIAVVKETRAKGGVPVLVTSMERKAGVEQPTLAGYPDAVREVAQREHCALIDLNAMSIAFYKALGSNLDRAFVDGTHHNNYGSYELAKCIMEGIKQTRLPLAAYISDDFKGFDPSHPDPVETFFMAASPERSMVKPNGN